MTMLLPPIPLAAIALALGALGGVAGSNALHPEDRYEQPAPVALPEPIAQAALVEDDDAGNDTRTHQVRRAADGMFYVWARVNGRRVRFLVDTGASVMVLTAADAHAVGAVSSGSGGRIQTASGHTAMAWTRLDAVAIGRRRVTGMRAAIVREGLGVSLLGGEMLARLGPMKIDGDKLEFS